MVQAKLSKKIGTVLKQQQELQQTTKPFLAYSRDRSWNGEPCDQCGIANKPLLSRGKYIVHDGENGLFEVCGVCLTFVESFFELSIE